MTFDAPLPDVQQQFRDARPFPHVVLDGLFSDDLLKRASREVPPADSPRWNAYRNKVDDSLPAKLGITDMRKLPAIQRISKTLASKRFTEWLSKISGIDGLISDRTLAGAGLHGITRGGLLGIHVDFDRLGSLYRRLNAFVYLNPGWQPEWGGGLELHGDNDPPIVIPPLLGRFVAFQTSEHSWHGHPHPLKCPAGRLRASIAVYYYTIQKPDWYAGDHSTIYLSDHVQESLR